MSRRFIYPSLMGSTTDASLRKTDEQCNNSDLAIKEYDGYTNAALEIHSEFVGVANRELVNRELVNLENAAVNIDNSSDVIIGPVTQFNVNGNVTIYQNKDGQPIGFDDNVETPNGIYNDKSSRSPKEDQEITFSTRKKLSLKLYLGIIFFFLALSVLAVILFFVLKQNTHQPSETNNESLINSLDFGSHRMIPKNVWNGVPPLKTKPFNKSVEFVIIKHTGGSMCSDFVSCAKIMQTIQSTDISVNDLDDIYFNFAIGNDGNIYTGRGWDVEPAYTNYNIDVVLLGNFAIKEFPPLMIETTQALLEFGHSIGKLRDDYKILNHNQTANTLSPGKNAIVEIRTWPHYDKNIYLGDPLMISTSSATSTSPTL